MLRKPNSQFYAPNCHTIRTDPHTLRRIPLKKRKLGKKQILRELNMCYNWYE